MSEKKLNYYLTWFFALYLSAAMPSFCDEKINAGVVYEFYIDVENSIVEIPSMKDKLPQITDEDVNLAYFKDFRPLNMLSLVNTYIIKPKNLSPTYQRQIPKEYNISLSPNKIAAAAKIVPSYEELLKKSLILKNKENYKEALETVNLALKENSKDPQGHFLKADILRLSGKYKDSIIEYHYALAYDPMCTDAYYNIAKILESADKKDLALDYYRYAYTTNPKDYEIRNIILQLEKSALVDRVDI